MAKVKVVNTNLDQNLNGTAFNNTASETIFQFGSFAVTSNFSGRQAKNYKNSLSSFNRPVTLETLGVTEVQSAVLHEYQINATLNLDKSDLSTYVRFGSTYEFFRVSVQEIILKYPGSLFVNSNTNPGGNLSVYDISYDNINDITTFKVPSEFIDNVFGIVFNQGNLTKPDDIETKNLNLSYDKYSVWSRYDPDNSYPIVGFTGDTPGITHIVVKAYGDPFSFISGATTGYFDFHIKPNNIVFEDYRLLLSNYEQYVVSERQGVSGFQFNVNDPTLLDDGNIVYASTNLLWTTTDGYNIDISNSPYQNFLDGLLTIGSKYDSVKTDLIARFLTPTSIKTYDLTQDGKMTKLLRVYGWEFDQMKKFIDSLTNINTVTYNKVNNIPDQLINNLARTFGWNYFTLVNESELVNSFLNIDDTERNLNTDLLPAEINIELWRRILLNTNYFWKSKGTREAIKAMFLMIGIPEPFINITEYVYTVDGKIDPRSVLLSQADFPTNSLPYDSSGYPVAPIETNSFYFQVIGDADSGQRYLDVFRSVGFNLHRTPDNKKSWVQTGATTRIHNTTPQYYQADSKLVINTKEVDVSLDTARGIEYDVYDYIKTDFAANSSGYTLPFSYVNLSLVYGGSNTYTLPAPYYVAEGDLEVRLNGILLNGPKEYSGSTTASTYQETTQADYIVSGNSFTITNNSYTIRTGVYRDVIQATYIFRDNSIPLNGITVEYIVARIKPNLYGTIIPLPSYPRGDVQVTINGIALTKGTSQFIADYIVDPNNSIDGTNNIIIQNPEIISYLVDNPNIQVAYVNVIGSDSINIRSEVIRVDSFNSSKIYFNVAANKYVFKLNYKINNAREVKILVDGIALEPQTDYSINVQNLFEIFLPRGLRYGSVISAYYLVGANDLFNPIVANDFNVGDISNLSFLEFIELIQRRLINARTRKTISDFKGGWYPTLLSVYIKYLQRGFLPESNPLHSNGYTFVNLYPFLSKYNAFFKKFVDELLSATIVLKQNGLLIRNTVFTKQKFMYKRGVNTLTNNRILVNYLGDDGSVFIIGQPDSLTLTLATTPGTAGIGTILDTGGFNITNFNLIDEYGIYYRSGTTGNWMSQSISGTLSVNNFPMSIIDLLEDTLYQYKAYVKSGVFEATGNTLTITTTTNVTTTPSITTIEGTGTINSIENTGGMNIIGWEYIEYYGMEYRTSSSSWQIYPPAPFAGPLSQNSFDITIDGLNANTEYEYRAYMVVAGNEYWGESYFLTTGAILTYIPEVTTGIVANITISGFEINNNVVTNDGNSPITEYGVLYTQNGIYGNQFNLICGNVPSVSIMTTNSTIPVGVNYQKILSGLADNTQTYYRAYASNAVGVGYGTVNTQETCAIPLIPVTTCLYRVFSPDINASNGCICFNPLLTTSQYVDLNIYTSQRVCTVGNGITELFCKANNSLTYNLIMSLNTSAAQCSGSNSISVNMNCGDMLCFQHSITGDAGSYGCIVIDNINGHSYDISPTISPIYYCDAVTTI